VARNPTGYRSPDGIVGGAEGTPLAGYVFTNDGSVTRFTNTLTFLDHRTPSLGLVLEWIHAT
jgi:hypothetical protein